MLLLIKIKYNPSKTGRIDDFLGGWKFQTQRSAINFLLSSNLNSQFILLELNVYMHIRLIN